MRCFNAGLLTAYHHILLVIFPTNLHWTEAVGKAYSSVKGGEELFRSNPASSDPRIPKIRTREPSESVYL